MSRDTTLLAVSMGIALGLAGDSLAQGPPPGAPAAPRPAVSPYLNLLRRDTLPAVNYYGLIRPQIATQNSLQSLQQQLTIVRTGEGAGPATAETALPITGQPAFFLNTGGYFLNSQIGTGPSRSLNTTRARPISPQLPARSRYR